MSNGHPTICYICDEPLDLAVERYTNNGKPIHEMCYIKLIVGDNIPGDPNGSMNENSLT
jgi:hypothetical protein